MGEQQIDQWSSYQFGDPPTLTCQPMERSVVIGLNEGHIWLGQQGRQQAGDEFGVEVRNIGIAEHNEVPGGHREGLPQGFALAGAGPEMGQDFGGADYLGSSPGRHLSSGIARPVVDHDDFVDHRRASGRLDESSHDHLHDGADGGLLVAGR